MKRREIDKEEGLDYNRYSLRQDEKEWLLCITE